MLDKLVTLLKVNEEQIELLRHLLSYSETFVLAFTGREELIPQLEVVIIEITRDFYIEQIEQRVKSLKEGEVTVSWDIVTLEEKLNKHKAILRYYTI